MAEKFFADNPNNQAWLHYMQSYQAPEFRMKDYQSNKDLGTMLDTVRRERQDPLLDDILKQLFMQDSMYADVPQQRGGGGVWGWFKDKFGRDSVSKADEIEGS